MATLRDALRIYLTADATLAAILTGGIKDANTLPQDGGGVASLPTQPDEVTVKPFAILRWRVATPKEIFALTERRNVEIYFYQDIGYTAIDRAKRRVKQLLDRQMVTADDAKICMFHWGTDVGELPAPEFDGIPCEMSRYYVDYTRK